ncbi:carbohydrate esterase family 3 protein [Cadophora sp. DSE1049]|nr:carbohydrate esterase family 3 protein [Cadophora sp. DSE1049]
MSSPALTREKSNIPPDLLQQLTTLAKFKDRSHKTCHETHLPILKYTKSLSGVLLGDSMIERFLTTGSSTQIAQLPSSLNAGCGGDKISNLIYRLLIMLPYLPSDVKVWVLMMGTNDLGKKKAVKDEDVDAYGVLVRALCEVVPKSNVLVCGVFERKDVLDDCVRETNGKLRGMVERLGDRVRWLEPPRLEKELHLDDHVHLNGVGYEVWDGVLVENIREMLGQKEVLKDNDLWKDLDG